MSCLVCGKPGDPHHLSHIGMGRNRKNELREHFTAIPLCREHHTEIHDKGKDRFNLTHRIDVWQEAFKLITKYMELQ